MSNLLFLVPIALGLGALGLVAFLWSVRSGQYDDLEGASRRILLDDTEDGMEPDPERDRDAGRGGDDPSRR